MTPDERREWLAARQHGIGSSDAPCLVGVGYKSAVDVYHRKVGVLTDEDVKPTGFRLRGLELEPLVARKYAERMQIDGDLEACAMVAHPDRPWQMASCDHRRPDRRFVELKTLVSWDEYGDDGSSEVPLGYFVQVQHQLGVTGTDFIDLAALHLFEWELRVFRIPFDPALFDWLTGVQERFLREHVEPRIPPGEDWEAQFVERLSAMAVKPGKAIDLGGQVEIALRERAERLDRVKADQARADEIRDEVARLMGDAESATAGAFKVKRGFVKGGHVSYDREPRWQLYIRESKPKAKK